MRVLLDECVPSRLRRELPGHDVRTVPEMGWAAKENGELLALAARAFDVFLTVDQKLSYQQNVPQLDIAVIVLVARRTKIEFLRPLMADVQQALTAIRSGEVRRIGVRP
jgi:predicted nuclease of predicted toxin-antitoxin system